MRGQRVRKAQCRLVAERFGQREDFDAVAQGVEVRKALRVRPVCAHGDGLVHVTCHDKLRFGKQAQAGLFGIGQVLEVVAQHVGVLLTRIGACVAFQIIGAQARRFLDEHGTALGQVAQAVVAGDFFFGAHPLIVGNQLAPLLVKAVEHFAQAANGRAERLHIFQEEVVLGRGKKAGNASGRRARFRGVQHAHAGIERSLDDNGVRGCVGGAERSAQPTAECLGCKSSGDFHEDGLRGDVRAQQGNAALYERFGLAAAGGSAHFCTAPVECGDGLDHRLSFSCLEGCAHMRKKLGYMIPIPTRFARCYLVSSSTANTPSVESKSRSVPSSKTTVHRV